MARQYIIVFMKNDDFTKLFKYIQEFRVEVNAKLDEKASKDDMQRVLNLLSVF